MPVRNFKSTAFAPISPARARLTGYDYKAFPVDVLPSCLAPSIIQGPVSRDAIAGNIVFFAVHNDGTSPLTLQWSVSTDDGVSWADLTNAGIYSGVDTPLLRITGIDISQSGYQYRCTITNDCGTITTDAATLTVHLDHLSAWVLRVGGAGGGSGISGGAGGGGGGGGKVQEALTETIYIEAHAVVVGDGGPGGSGGLPNGQDGGQTSFNGVTAPGGVGAVVNSGVGDGGASGSGESGGAGQPGGSGGGGGGDSQAGGAGGVPTNCGGNGGNGTISSITGTPTYYGGGGGACGGHVLISPPGVPGVGGLGGGGNGAYFYPSAPGGSGTDGLGGGGGGAKDHAGGTGGKGIVIIRYAGPARFTGGTITTIGGDTLHTFTSSGTLTPI